MKNLPITCEANQPEQLIHLRRDGREVLVVTYAEARQLLGELGAVLLEVDGRPGGAALGGLLDTLADGLHRRAES